ncbi:hypothetical protein DBR42_29130, partial [Pelomonas sp. HMWF004]
AMTQIPAGWQIERRDDRHIVIKDPSASYDVVLDLSDQALVMRVFWRLCSDLIDAAALAAQQQAAASST